MASCEKMKRKKNYAMRKLNTPKRVYLPDGRSFLARYERIPRSELPANIIMNRTSKTRAVPKEKRRRQPQQGARGIFSTIKKITKNPLLKKVAKKGLEYAPGLYPNLKKRSKK